MIESETKGGFNFKPFSEYFFESISARITAKTAAEFVGYLKNRRFDELFHEGSIKNRRGKKTGLIRISTRDSIGMYRYKSKKPAYTVKAGIGIPGSLNYLEGLYKGGAVSKSGKPINYTRKRDLITGGWKSWGGVAKTASIGEAVLQKALNSMEGKIGS
jgi:hypothetical protein